MRLIFSLQEKNHEIDKEVKSLIPLLNYSIPK